MEDGQTRTASSNHDSRYTRLRGDFSGLFSELLCLSHRDTCEDENGNAVVLRPGMLVIAFDPDIDENGNPDELFAAGVVERPPEWLRCRGSRWVLRFDENGARHESDLRDEIEGA